MAIIIITAPLLLTPLSKLYNNILCLLHLLLVLHFLYNCIIAIYLELECSHLSMQTLHLAGSDLAPIHHYVSPQAVDQRWLRSWL